MEQLLAFDFEILDAIQATYQSPLMDKIMTFISMFGNGGALWVIISLILLISKKTRRCGLTMIVALVLMLSISNGLIKNLVMRPRPFQLREFQLLIAPPSGYSFPSGHTSSSFAGASTMFIYNKPWGTVALIMATVIAFSRLYLYVHFPTDVICGAIVGVLFAMLALFLVNRASMQIENTMKLMKKSE